MKTRRQFLSTAATAIAATGFTSLYGNPLPRVTSDKPGDAFTLGMAGYTFREFTVEQTIAMMQRIGVKCLSVKDFHLPYNSNQEQIKAVLDKFRNAGIEVYTLGVIYMKTNEFVDQAFEYAKMAGVNMIVGAPDYALLPYVEKKVKTYDIRLAIHNHGPDNPLYPNA
ncbi:MAG: twin-arginine translocation signal domain-containing protein, partial [Bacteroidales bacterium]|nr:twin-arginine translocation signal domain-containing protein [Bacteroidales bacterium]